MEINLRDHLFLAIYDAEFAIGIKCTNSIVLGGFSIYDDNVDVYIQEAV